MLNTSPSFQRMENDDLTAKARKPDRASHKVGLEALPIHQNTSQSERFLWTSSNNVDMATKTIDLVHQALA